MVTDDAGHGIYEEFDEIGCPCRLFRTTGPGAGISGRCSDVPVAEKRGMYNLDLSKANVETSLLACLCNAICNCEAG